MTVDSAVTPTLRSRTRQLLSTSAGNLVEWYDWLAYAFLTTYFADQVFPDTGHSLVPLLSAFAVFAVGFVMRPIGGLAIGAIADRAGRRPAMTLTVALMGVSQLAMVFLPTYAQAGLLSPLLLIVIRLVQGFSVGGEFAVSSVFLVESAPPGRRGLFSSFSYFSSNLGQLMAAGVASLLGNMLSMDQMSSWGWRLAFALGALLSLLGLWVRYGAEETYVHAEAIRKGAVDRPGLFDFLRRHPKESMLIVGMTAGATVSFYTWSIYLPTYATITAGADPARALTVSTIALVFFTAIQPLGGLLADRVGRKPLLVVFGAGFTVLTVPMLGMLQDSFWNLLLISCVAMVLLTGYTSVCSAVMVELFPSKVRTTGIGFPYALTVALFGGTAPYVATMLADGGHGQVFGWYASALTLVSTVVYIRMRETRDTVLD
ncbi:MFS transporter [Streptosporangium sp. NPDC020072]|uniref:MFS transporter n=1 Tax=unclassified Streptosporangium TaxID=2632669 RepID=UPI003422F163